MIFDQNPEYRDGAVREMIINLSNMCRLTTPIIHRKHEDDSAAH